MKRPKLSLVIPAYNEEKRIGKTLDGFTAFFDKSGIDYEIFVMANGCTDGTPKILRQKSKKNRHVRYRVSREKLGKGGALLAAFSNVSGENVAYTDADGSTSPGEILRLMKMMEGYDGVIGSRWLKGSVVERKQGIGRRIASRGFNLMTRMVLGLPYTDTQCPAKVFRGTVIRDMLPTIKVKDFAIDASILYEAKKRGYRIREIPISWKDEPMSTVRMRKAVPRMFATVIKLRLGL
jgi:glycosyltransferase involved in cell wall biosynthesis